MKKWKKYNGALIPELPPHMENNVNIVALKKMLTKENAFFARWISDFDRKKKSDFWHIINDKPLELNDYSINTRSKIRRGFKELDVKRINKQELLKYGYSVYIAAFKRYKTINKPMSHNQYLKYIQELDDLWEYWGVYHKKDNLLIAYSQNKVVHNQCYYSTIKFHVDYLRKYPSYVLYYTMNSYYLKQRKVSYVNEGTRSILHETNVQSFLIEKFKFRKAYCNLHIQYHPLINIFVFILYPFRRLIIRSNNKFLRKVGVVLIQEQYHKTNKFE